MILFSCIWALCLLQQLHEPAITFSTFIARPVSAGKKSQLNGGCIISRDGHARSIPYHHFLQSPLKIAPPSQIFPNAFASTHKFVPKPPVYQNLDPTTHGVLRKLIPVSKCFARKVKFYPKAKNCSFVGHFEASSLTPLLLEFRIWFNNFLLLFFSNCCCVAWGGAVVVRRLSCVALSWVLPVLL